MDSDKCIDWWRHFEGFKNDHVIKYFLHNAQVIKKKGQNVEVELINYYFFCGFVKVLSERVSITTGPASAVVNATQGAAVGSAAKIA